MSNQVIEINLGSTVESARQAAIDVAAELYAQAPINDARGQTFKNEFVKSLFNRSERAARAAKAFLGSGSVKPVISGFEEVSYEKEVEEEYTDDYDNEDYNEDCTCCHCLDK